MALTNQQYDKILREYEDIRNRNRLLSEEKREKIDREIPGLRPLENRIATLTVQRTMQALDGKNEQLRDTDEEIALMRSKCDSLLLSAGYTKEDLEPIYDCVDCQDTGYRLQNGYQKKCHCFMDRELAILYDQSGIREMLRTNNFEHLSYIGREKEDLSRLETAVRVCKDFVQNFSKDYQNLVFCGTVGTGKSFLSCCIAAELIKEHHYVLYLSSQYLFDTLSAIRFGKSQEHSDFAQQLRSCELLIIDDLGTELTNSFVASELFSILNDRHMRRAATILSTNLDLPDIRDRYSDRVLSRLTGNYSFLLLSGPDMRQY